MSNQWYLDKWAEYDPPPDRPRKHRHRRRRVWPAWLRKLLRRSR